MRTLESGTRESIVVISPKSGEYYADRQADPYWGRGRDDTKGCAMKDRSDER